MQFGPETYRAGALERIDEAYGLWKDGRYALAQYAGGLAVEGMLRALCGLRKAYFDDKHNLKRLATRVRDLGLLRPNERDEDFVATVEGVARRWLNILRFADQRQLERFLVGLGELPEKQLERGLRPYCNEYLNACFRVVKRCNQRWMKTSSRPA